MKKDGMFVKVMAGFLAALLFAGVIFGVVSLLV